MKNLIFELRGLKELQISLKFPFPIFELPYSHLFKFQYGSVWNVVNISVDVDTGLGVVNLL